MELAVLKFATLCFVVLGLSHIVQPRVWVQFFIEIRKQGEVGSFINAIVQFPFGALIVAFHNVWHGIPMALTLIGWCLVLKCFVSFVFPRYGLKMLSRLSLERAWEFAAAGVALLALGSLLLFSIVSRT